MSKITQAAQQRRINSLVSEIASTVASDWLTYTLGTAAQKQERLVSAQIAYAYLLQNLEELLSDNDLDLDPTRRANLRQLYLNLQIFILQRNLIFAGLCFVPHFHNLVINLFLRLARLDLPATLYETIILILFYFDAFPAEIRTKPFPIVLPSSLLPFLIQLLVQQAQILENQPELTDFQSPARSFLQAVQISDSNLIKALGLDLYRQLQQFMIDRGDAPEEPGADTVYDLAALAKILINEAAESILDCFAYESDGENENDEDDNDSDDPDEELNEIDQAEDGPDDDPDDDLDPDFTDDRDQPTPRVIFGFDEPQHRYYLQTAQDTIFVEPARPEEQPFIAKIYALFADYCQDLAEVDNDGANDGKSDGVDDEAYLELLEKYRELFTFIGHFAPLELLGVYLLIMENLLSYDQEQFTNESAAALLTTFGEILEALLASSDFAIYPDLEMQLQQFVAVLKEFLTDDPSDLDEDDFSLRTNRLINLIGLVEDILTVKKLA